MKAVLLCTVNIWKETNSGNVRGIFTNRKKLEKYLRKLIKWGDIELCNGSPVSLPLRNFSIKEMHDNFNYLSLQKINLNEEI